MAVFSWLIVFSLLFFWFWKNRRPKGFPPGPWRLPLFGNLLQFNMRDPLKSFDQFAKKYGPVFSLYLGSKPVVLTHGFLSAKEVFVIKGTEFAGRSDFYIIDMFTKKKGAPLDPYELIDSAVTNILSTIIFGKRFEYDSNFLRSLLDLIHQNIRLPAGPWALLFNAVPLVRRLPLPHQKILTNVRKMFDLLEKEMEEHKATLTPGEPRDFIDAYLEEIQKPERKGSSFEEEQLRVLLFDLLIAGTETTSGTLQWAFLYLVAFPEIQEKCWKEIDTVLGNKARLKCTDRVRLPYTNAVIHEIQRMSSIVPLGVARKTINDVQLFGYRIPKDTMVFVNIQSAHHDESQWKFPNEFNPSNFLNEEGDFVKPEAFLPFSAGPRVCLGEILARIELFLLFTSIVRNFQLLWPDKSQAPDFTPHFAVTQSPSRFKVLLKCRQLQQTSQRVCPWPMEAAPAWEPASVQTPVVFTHGFPSAKEVLVAKGTEFAGRAEFPIMDVITHNKERNGSSFEEGQLEILLSDQLVAGTETTSGTLQWGFLYLVAFPGIQVNRVICSSEKCWKEIDTVVGNEASLKYEDRKRMPYTNAVIHEIQRISNVVPLGIPHASIKDVQLFGYKIPKNTMVLVNTQSAHHDESQWKFPNEAESLLRGKPGSDGALPLLHQHSQELPVIVAR
ncbi:Cytochrome protein, partial [Ophiophagus hannah]